MTDLLIPLLIVLVLVVMWRGPKTLPKLGEALGRGVRARPVPDCGEQPQGQARQA
ncbi:MAG: twin-arginine translocase TatA/TatE family subunit [Chloroflexi bacterium]|nr:twin-arginine translocase TatA/TatE family subunit [Chloroflexota bacterium]